MYMQLPKNNSHMTAGLNAISAEEVAEVGCFFFNGYFSKLEAVFQVYSQSLSLSSCLPQLL